MTRNGWKRGSVTCLDSEKWEGLRNEEKRYTHNSFIPFLTQKRTCEICGSTARNVTGANESESLEQWNEANDAAAGGPVPSAVTRRFWRGSRFLNFLLACMVFAFVISWLFHFNVPS